MWGPHSCQAGCSGSLAFVLVLGSKEVLKRRGCLSSFITGLLRSSSAMYPQTSYSSASRFMWSVLPGRGLPSLTGQLLLIPPHTTTATSSEKPFCLPPPGSHGPALRSPTLLNFHRSMSTVGACSCYSLIYFFAFSTRTKIPGEQILCFVHL